MKFGQLILRRIDKIVATKMSDLKAKNAPKSNSNGAPPQTPLRELTALPQIP